MLNFPTVCSKLDLTLYLKKKSKLVNDSDQVWSKGRKSANVPTCEGLVTGGEGEQDVRLRSMDQKKQERWQYLGTKGQIGREPLWNQSMSLNLLNRKKHS